MGAIFIVSIVSRLNSIQFQYLSLLRFGSTKQAKVVCLENKLKIWEDRRPLFRHCVTGFDALQRELQAAREQLLKLGQDVSSIEATLKLTSSNPSESGNNVTTKLVGGLTSVQTSGSNPSHSNTRNRSRLAQASANDLDEIKSRSNVVKDPRYELDMKQDYAVESRDLSVGKRRRIESKSDEVAQRVLAHQYHQSPATRSRDAMPPPSIPARVLRTPKTAFNAQNGRTIDSPMPKFLPTVNVNRESYFNPNTPNFHNPKYSPICSGINAPFYLTQNHHGSLFATGRQQNLSQQVSADQATPVQMLAQGCGQQSYLTPLHHDGNGVHSFPQGKQGHLLLNAKTSPLDRIRTESDISPYAQDLVNSLELDKECAEMNSSSKTVSGADPMVHQANSSGGFPKDHTFTDPYYRNDKYPEIPYRTGKINNGSFFSAIDTKRMLGSRNNRIGTNDGELDNDFIRTLSPIKSTFKTTPARLSLPPRGSSSIGTPRLRTGMSANARSSSNIFIPPTPTTVRPHREPLGNVAMSNPYVPSPYFSHQILPRPPQSSTPLVDHSKSPGRAKTFVETPFRIDQRSQAGLNRPFHEYLKGGSGLPAGPPAHAVGRSSAASMRRACR